MSEDFGSLCCEDDGKMHCDIIFQLYGIRADHLIRNIFSYLDHKEISRAESVSKSWHEIIEILQPWKLFSKSKISQFPLWKRFFELLKSDPTLFPTEGSISFKGFAKTVFESCKALESDWNKTDDYHLEGSHSPYEKHFSCYYVDSNPSSHLQIDDNFIAVKNLKGSLEIWSRKTGSLVKSLELSKCEDKFGNEIYTIGDELVISSAFDGVIKVWDVITGLICSEVYELKGFQITSLKYSPENGILIASSQMINPQKSQSFSLLTVWKANTNKKGHFALKFQQKLPERIKMLRILGLDTKTLGILCTEKPQDQHQVHIYSQDDPFNLITSIKLGIPYELDWADGYLVISHNRKIELYSVSTGACLDSWDASVINGNVDKNLFSICCNQVKVCSTHIVTINEHLNGGFFIWAWKFVENVFDPVKGNTVSLKLMNPDGFRWELKSLLEDYDVECLELLKVNEFQIVVMILHWEAGRHVIVGPGYRICNFQLLDVFPTCAYCGLLKHNMKQNRWEKLKKFCNNSCWTEFQEPDSVCCGFCEYPSPWCKSGCCIDCHPWCNCDSCIDRESSCKCDCCLQPNSSCKSVCCVEDGCSDLELKTI